MWTNEDDKLEVANILKQLKTHCKTLERHVFNMWKQQMGSETEPY